MTQCPYIETLTQGAVAIIRLNRPEIRNAVNRDTSFAVYHAIMAAEADPAIGAIIITGTGDKAFCSGMDLREAQTNGSGTGLVPGAGFLGITERVCKKPLIGALNGSAVAGGFEVALACDLLVASENALLGLPEIKRGMVAFSGGVQRLAQLLPRQKAFEIIYTGNYLTAQEAAGFGLVNRVVAPDQVLPAALELAEQILANSWKCLDLAKQLYHVARDTTLEQAVAWGHARGGELMNSSDSREGIAAYNAKRDAQFANG